MSDFEAVGNVADFPTEGGKAVVYDGRMVAVFRDGEDWFAIDDLCPHMGASLSEGHVEGRCVTCPWHAWRFDVSNGQWEDNPRVSVECFDVKVEDEQVWVRQR